MKRFITRFFAALIGILSFLGIGLSGHAQVLETVAYTGHLVRTTPKLADLDLTSMYGKPLVITRDMNGIIVNGSSEFANNKRIAKKAVEDRFSRLQGTRSEAVQNPNAQFPNVPTSSILANFDGQLSAGLSPTDNNIAAGPNHVIQAVNNSSGTAFRVYDKNGNPLTASIILATLTGFPGFGDPVVLYDQLANRWLIVEFGPSPPTHNLNIAVSNTGDPTGTWSIYQYQDLTFFIDYHKFSVWHNAYYATSNDFNNAGTAYLGSSVYSMDRAAMIAGAPTAVMIRTRLNDAGQNYYNMNTIGLEGMNTSSQNGLFAFPIAPTTLNLFEVTPNFGAATQTVGPLIPLTIASYGAPPNSVAQQGTGTIINTLGQRLMFKLNYRNNSGTESIVIAHTIGNAGLAAVRWYELRRVAGNWTVFQQGTVTGSDGNSRFMPGISMDGCGNIALMYNKSGSTSFPSMVYTGRNASDPLGQMTLPEATIINGTTFHTNSRWGDYNTTVQDYSAVGSPANNTFWSTAQYANQRTRIAKYTITGGCAPLANIIADGWSLVSESCVPANGVIDPGETVTVSFCLKNVGTSNTTNAVGTLLATGGVISPSAPQNYGVIVMGGANVCQQFSFTNNSSICGGTITASIQVQDGVDNLGTVNFPITLGTTVNVTSQNFDAVAAPALPAGWSSTASGAAATPWVTSTSGTPAPPVVSAPNAAFVPNPGDISDNILESAAFSPGASATVTFQNNYSFENGNWDGGVMEISINGGAWTDILLAGGSFASGGYTGTIQTGFGNPLANRQGWTNSSGGFITTTVNLPNAASGQSVRVRFRMGSDDIISAPGWRIDNFSVNQPSCCGAICTITCPSNVTVSASAGQCGAVVTYPPATTSGLCGPITYSRPSGSFFPVGTTTVTVSAAAGPTCTFTVTVVDNVPPVITCPANITVPNGAGICGAVVNYSTPTVTDNCPLPGQYNLSQSVTRNIVAIQIGCQSGGLTTANSWWRAYDLAPLALPAPLTINSVTFGIERVTAASGSIPLTIRLYTSAGAFPAGARTLIATQAFTATNAMTNTIQTVAISTPPTVPTNAIVAVEVFAPDGRAPVNHTFFIGSNAGGQTGPSYIEAPDCGANVPTNLATLGFPNDHIILDISGTVPVVPPVVQQTAGLPSGSTFPVGTTTNTFTATDAAGNTATCSFTVTVNDTEQPTITCPGSVVRNTDPGVCYSTYTPPQPTFADNCSVTRLTWVMTGATTGSSPATGINYVPSTNFGLTGTTGVGVTTITYTAADAAGNTRTCSFTVTVNDASIPVISVQPATKFVCVGSDGEFKITASAGAGNPLAYQWQQWNGSAWVNITGATSSTLTLPGVTFAMNSNSYRCILTGRCSVVTSNFATLYINPLPTVTVVTSIPPALLPGQSLNIISTVNPAGGTYAWYRNGILLTSPLQQGPVLSGLTVDDIGTFRLVYTDLNTCTNSSADVVVSGLASDKLWVYPVPNNGQFQVRFFNQVGEQATVRVFDAKGAKVYERSVVTSTAYTQIDVNLGPSMPDGTYVVELVNAAGDRVGAKKIIVRKKP